MARLDRGAIQRLPTATRFGSAQKPSLNWQLLDDSSELKFQIQRQGRILFAGLFGMAEEIHRPLERRKSSDLLLFILFALLALLCLISLPLILSRVVTIRSFKRGFRQETAESISLEPLLHIEI